MGTLWAGEHSPVLVTKLTARDFSSPFPSQQGIFPRSQAPNGAIPVGIPKLRGELPCLLATDPEHL